MGRSTRRTSIAGTSLPLELLYSPSLGSFSGLASCPLFGVMWRVHCGTRFFEPSLWQVRSVAER
ncbi:hypothetical protein OBBRIDRAFT_311325 [Obba rivulosa]|uniref:Uncharacterized protein n=1 Tax=Obba rivulosa TaxID=1052685 RepID=A0A8E2AP05_9APHY|nr:hypothetical protein OBBRIDRAFT_311325 [Obba rivulosa]